jgi:hypothetical protein
MDAENRILLETEITHLPNENEKFGGSSWQ